MTGEVLAGHDTARIQHLDRTDRDRSALDNLRRIAPDDHELLADILGLNQASDSKVSSMPLTEPGDGKYGTGGKRPARRKPSDAPHGTYARYQGGPCHCDLCDEAGRDYRAAMRARKQPAR